MASCFRGGSGISSISSLPSLPHRTRLSVLPVKCLSSRQSRDSDSDSDLRTTPSPSSTSGFSPYGWCAGIGGVGFLETTYLSYLKLTNSDAFCPIGGASCGDVLNSDYAVVFGIIYNFPFCFVLVALLWFKTFIISIKQAFYFFFLFWLISKFNSSEEPHKTSCLHKFKFNSLGAYWNGSAFVERN